MKLKPPPFPLPPLALPPLPLPKLPDLQEFSNDAELIAEAHRQRHEAIMADLAKRMREEATAVVDGNVRTLQRVLSPEVPADGELVRTPWFPLGSKPVRVGRYEIGLGGTGPFPPLVHAHRHLWGGKGWDDQLPPGACWWRGLTKDYS